MQTDPELSDEIRRFEEQYAENPDSLVFARLADLHRKAGRPERALEILDDGLERHPDYLSAHIVRARCLRGLGRLDGAEDVFRRVLELDSENLVALRSLAEMAWERGDGETARRHLEELLQLDPRNEEARDLMQEIRDGGAHPGGADTADAWEEEEEEPFIAEDDPFATPSWAEPRRPEPQPEEPEPGEAEGFEEPEPEQPDDGTIIEPSSRREAAEPAEAEPEAPEPWGEEPGPPGEPAEPAGLEEPDAFGEPDEPPTAEEPGEVEEPAELAEPGISEPLEEAGAYEPGGEEPAADRDEAAGERAFDVEPVEAEEEPTEPAEPSGAMPAPEPGDEEEGDRWWDVLRSGPEGADASEEPEPDAPTPDVATPETEDAREPSGGPAVGPASEAEELEEQIEELRLQAEQETDLSDADEDLATETLANLYEAQGFYREAVKMYEELVAQRPDDRDLRRRLERAREALEDAGDAVRSAPGTEPSAGPVEEGSEEAAAPAEPTTRSIPGRERVTAASQLRAVLRGDASPEGPDADVP